MHGRIQQGLVPDGIDHRLERDPLLFGAAVINVGQIIVVCKGVFPDLGQSRGEIDRFQRLAVFRVKTEVRRGAFANLHNTLGDREVFNGAALDRAIGKLSERFGQNEPGQVLIMMNCVRGESLYALRHRVGCACLAFGIAD